ncbi:MAG: hypothetical protein ABFD77_09345 [Thermotogota bacterium]
MGLVYALGVLSIASAVASGVIGSLIAELLETRGAETNRRFFALLRRRHILRYLRVYCDVTTRETGRVGPLYYAYVCAIIGMIVFGVTAILFRIAILSRT